MKIKLFFSLSCLFLASQTAWAGTCTVDATQTNQSIRGFGAASVWNAASNLTSWAQTLWADDNVNGHVGFSILRTRIDPTDTGSGAAWNSEAAPMTLAKSINSNILIWSTAWSPPAAYKGNNSVNGGGSNGALNSSATFTGAASGAANAADTGYAAYLTRYVQYIQSKFGVTLYAVSPQNEPDWDPTYEAAIWNAGQFDIFTQAFHAALQTAGLSTKIMITESFHDNLALAATTMNDATAAPMVGIIGAHLYGGGPNNIATAGWSHLTNQESWMTEISDGNITPDDHTMLSAMEEAGWIHKSMVTGNMNAFIHWWIWSGSTASLIDDSNNTITKRPMVIGNYSKFVRPGFYRMGATTVPTGGVSVTAYKNTNTSSPTTIVIVAINGNNAITSQTFSLNGLSVSSMTPWLTDGSNDLVRQTAVAVSGNNFTYSMPVSSVVSFVGVNNGGSNPTATFTRTNTPVPPTATRTSTATFTRTNTPVPPTNTFTSTATATRTSTATLTFSPTATFTRTNTSVPPTPTFTSTNTATRTSTPSNTSTKSFTSTPTSTFSSTPTATVTFTPSATFTRTNTPVPPTTTFTSTNTATRTFTPSNTFTNSATSTPTLTFSSTPTATLTFTKSSTATWTITGTPTFTRTTTATATTSQTFTATTASTSTDSFTPTASFTRTKTSTPTWTATSSTTFTSTYSSTATSTHTSTATPTATSSLTSTPTTMNSLTSTSTSTFTTTKTDTPTGTATPSNTSSSTATPTFTSSSTATVTFTPTLTRTSSATSTSTNSHTPSSTSTFTPTKTATPTLTDSSTSTPTFTSTKTSTFTFSPTATPTTTFTNSPTATLTMTATFTMTPSFTRTFTATVTRTPTATVTPVPSVAPGTVGIYPNPATGPIVHILPAPYLGFSNVRVEIFTVNFRKVQDRTFYAVPAGTELAVNLTDREGRPLANGLYYVVVTTNSGRVIGKLLVLR